MILKGGDFYHLFSVKKFFWKNMFLGVILCEKSIARIEKLWKIFRGQKIETNASKLGVISFNPNKIIFRGNFVRGIDCAHRKILKKFFGGQKPQK